jgi:hypothetical protein
MEQIYNYRVRVVNVPMIAPADPQYVNSGYETNENGPDALAEGEFEDFVEEVKYKFCDGASGYVQTNAKYIGNTGEATGDISRIENSVFPMIAITDDKFGTNGNCIQTGDDKNLNFFGFRAPDGGMCNPEEARDSENASFSELGSDLQCNFRETDVSFVKFDSSRELTVYRPGWFFKECTEGSSGSTVETQLIDDRVRWQPSGGNTKSRSWELANYGDISSLGIPFTFNYERQGSGGIVKIFVNGQKRLQMSGEPSQVRMHSYNNNGHVETKTYQFAGKDGAPRQGNIDYLGSSGDIYLDFSDPSSSDVFKSLGISAGNDMNSFRVSYKGPGDGNQFTMSGFEIDREVSC